MANGSLCSVMLLKHETGSFFRLRINSVGAGMGDLFLWILLVCAHSLSQGLLCLPCVLGPFHRPYARGNCLAWAPSIEIRPSGTLLHIVSSFHLVSLSLFQGHARFVHRRMPVPSTPSPHVGTTPNEPRSSFFSLFLLPEIHRKSDDRPSFAWDLLVWMPRVNLVDGLTTGSRAS